MKASRQFCMMQNFKYFASSMFSAKAKYNVYNCLSLVKMAGFICTLIILKHTFLNNCISEHYLLKFIFCMVFFFILYSKIRMM